MKSKFKKGITTVLATTTLFVSIFQAAVSVRADMNDIQNFVRSLYVDCLGRQPDQIGFDYWCSRLQSGEITGKQCAYGFFFSTEFTSKANSLNDTDYINTFYNVFLNRGYDSTGLAYWNDKISDTVYDTTVLFTGFADSVEFANKCASYGITVGTVSTPTVGSSGQATQTSNANNLAAQTNGARANSVEELDAYWISQGYEVMYINLGNGASQKVYAHFYDMTEHNNQLNAWRNQNGLPSLTLITDPNDIRYQFARRRAVEVALMFAHKSPKDYTEGIYDGPDVPADQLRENIANGVVNTSIDGFRNSYIPKAQVPI